MGIGQEDAGSLTRLCSICLVGETAAGGGGAGRHGVAGGGQPHAV